MGRTFDIISLVCAILVIVFIIAIEPSSGYIKFKYGWAKYFFLLLMILSAIISWMNLGSKRSYGLKKNKREGKTEFLFSREIHKLKELKLWDGLILNISSVAIVILLLDLLDLDYFLFSPVLSVDGWTTLLLISIISGISFFILDLIGAQFFMNFLITGTILYILVIGPATIWIISLFISGFNVNFLGAFLVSCGHGSLLPRWRKLLTKAGVISSAPLVELEIAKGEALAHTGMYEEAIKCFDKAIELNPELKEAHDNRRLVLNMRKNQCNAEKSESDTYSNDKYGFSIRCPKGWRFNDYKLPPEMLIRFIDPRGGEINIVAGPTYGTQESIEDSEKYAIQNVHRLNGEMKSLKRIKVDNVEAVEAIYLASGLKTKKVGFVKDGVEYIITCGIVSNLFDEYKAVFDECIQSFKFKRRDQ